MNSQSPGFKNKLESMCDNLTQIRPIQPYPALILKKKHDRALVVSDLHIGWERLLSKRGVHIPSQITKIKKILLSLIKKCKPTQVIFLGDVKDAIAKVAMEEWIDIPEFFEEIQKKVSDIQVILGNHDGNLEPLLPETVKILSPTGISYGDVGLFHGHAWPTLELLECRSLISGHVHPTVAIRDPMGFRMTRRVLVKASCNGMQLARSLLNYLATKKNCNNSFAVVKEPYKLKVKVLQLFIMPSFNHFLGGRPINEIKKEKKKNEAFIGPILRSGSVNIDDAEVYLLDGTFLGTVDQLRALS